MSKRILLISIMLVVLAVFSLNTVNACDDTDDDVIVYDCSIWSNNDAMVNLGVHSWPLLDGTARVTSYKLQKCIGCSCCNCNGDFCGPCLCSADTDICCCCNDDCCVDCDCSLTQGLLTHRGTRGLGVSGGSNDDEIDVIGGNELIMVFFNEPQNLISFEVRSLFNESYLGRQVYEECDVIISLGTELVQRFHLVGKELIGTGNGAVVVSGINKCFDRMVFVVVRGQTYSPYSDFAVAKIKTSNNEISFVQPITGVDCDNDMNQPPVANDNNYMVSEGSILTVIGSEGVLQNDYDDDGDSLTAVKSSEPSNGVLIFNSDGSFTYTPNEGFSGVDSFTYKANDGKDDSNIATVTINVVDVMPSITVRKTSNPSTIVEPGSDVVFTIEISNTGVEPVTLVSLVDNIFGDLNGVGNCAISQIIPAGGSYICSFTKMISGEDGDFHFNNVTATVVDNEGNFASNYDWELVFIVKCEGCGFPPNAIIVGPYEGKVGETIVFNGSISYDLDGIIVNYTWDFGDGTAIGYGVEVSHVYSAVGTYTITLTVKDDDDATNSTSILVTIKEENNNPGDDDGDDEQTTTSGGPTTRRQTTTPPNQPPVANAGGPYKCFLGEEIQFNGSLSTDDKGIVLYEWDFGDGTTGSEKIVKHTYTLSGEYKVTLTVKDAEGKTDYTETIAVVIQPNRSPSPPTVSIDEDLDLEDNILIGIVDTEYTFNVSATDPDGNNIRYIVEWGDGTSDETGMLPSGLVASLNHKWKESGTYIVNVTAVDEDGKPSEKVTLQLKINEKEDEPTQTNFAALWLLFLAVVVASLILILILFRKTKKDNTDEIE